MRRPSSRLAPWLVGLALITAAGCESTGSNDASSTDATVDTRPDPRPSPDLTSHDDAAPADAQGSNNSDALDTTSESDALSPMDSVGSMDSTDRDGPTDRDATDHDATDHGDAATARDDAAPDSADSASVDSAAPTPAAEPDTSPGPADHASDADTSTASDPTPDPTDAVDDPSPDVPALDPKGGNDTLGAEGSACVSSADCAPTPLACHVVACTDGVCTLEESPEASPCSDHNACTTDDRCFVGRCIPGPPLPCDDGNACTEDACNRLTGCFTRPIDGPCSDGDACTAGDRCELGQCRPGPALACDDHNPCTDDTCAPASGCVHTPNTAPCDDHDVCTLGDVCRDGQCAGGTPRSCADNGDRCTDPGCDPIFGCVALFNQTPCDDGDACTDGDICVGGQCLSGAEINCPAGGACSTGGCNPAVGCTVLPRTGPCDDGDRCTVGDLCEGTACRPGSPVSCDDGNPCTLDACSPLAGCTHTPSTGSCDAGVACSDGVCRNGACEASPPRLWSWVEAATDANGYLGALLGLDDGVLVIGTRNLFPAASGRVMKFDRYGALVWTQLVGDGWLYTGARDGDGFVFGGETPVEGNWQGWLVGTDSGGAVRWSFTFGGAGSDTVNSVVAQDDGFTIAGTTTSLGAGRRGWVAHVDRAGTIVWEQGFGDVGGWTEFFQVAPTADGGALGVGYLNHGSSWYGGLVKVDAQGEIVFEQTHGDSGDDGWVGVAERADGHIAVYGYVTAPDNRYDLAWAQTDAAGNLLWTRGWRLAGTGEFPTRVAHYPDGGAVIGASSTANSGDLFALRVDADGSPRFGRLLARAGYDEMYGVAALPDGGLVIGGYQFAGGLYQTEIYRVSTWGHTTCEEAGLCVDRPQGTCADGESCTRDVCDPLLGCRHESEADGVECGVDRSCESGICLEVAP